MVVVSIKSANGATWALEDGVMSVEMCSLSLVSWDVREEVVVWRVCANVWICCCNSWEMRCCSRWWRSSIVSRRSKERLCSTKDGEGIVAEERDADAEDPFTVAA